MLAWQCEQAFRIENRNQSGDGKIAQKASMQLKNAHENQQTERLGIYGKERVW
jgi:hypothetical protein